MKTLLSFIRFLDQHKLALLVGFILSLLTIIASVGLMSLSGWFISAAAFAGLTTATSVAFNFFAPSAGVRAFSFIRILARYGERVVTHHTTFSILTRLRVWLYKHIEPLAPSHLIRFKSGDLLNRLTHDISQLDNLYLRVLSPSIIALCLSGMIFIFLQFFNLTIAIITLGFMLVIIFGLPPIMLLLGKSAGVALTEHTKQLRNLLFEHKHFLAEQLIFQHDQTHLNKLNLANKKLIQAQTKMAHYKGLSQAFVLLICGISFILALYLGIQTVETGALHGANLALIVLCIMAAYEALFPLPIAYQYLGETRQSAKRLKQITTIKPEITFPIKSAQFPADMRIEYQDVSFTYEGQNKPTLHAFNLTVNPGTHLAIMGSTGAGKSTLVHLLTRIYDPCSGEILLGGVPLKKLAEIDLRATICFIHQNPHLFNASIKDNLNIANIKATDDELFNVLKTVQLYDKVKSLPEGLNTWLGETGVHLSGGETKRLFVARALLSPAPIIVLDEPTEGLDNPTSNVLINAISQTLTHKTLIIITHKQRVADKLDQILKL